MPQTVRTRQSSGRSAGNSGRATYVSVGLLFRAASGLQEPSMPRLPLRHVAEPDLFAGNDPSQPLGLRYEPAAITPDEERTLSNALQSLPLAPFQFGAFEV